MSRFYPKPSTDDAVGLSTSTAAPTATGRRGVGNTKAWLVDDWFRDYGNLYIQEITIRTLGKSPGVYFVNFISSRCRRNSNEIWRGIRATLSWALLTRKLWQMQCANIGFWRICETLWNWILVKTQRNRDMDSTVFSQWFCIPAVKFSFQGGTVKWKEQQSVLAQRVTAGLGALRR